MKTIQERKRITPLNKILFFDRYKRQINILTHMLKYYYLL